ncbi:MAG: glycosyltransferase family 39 protein [Candidatus Beckwithbacteria bacterium]
MMKKLTIFSKTTFFKNLVFSIIFVLAILIRFWKIEYLPYQSDWDEYAYIFAGQSLIETGEPVSVSGFTSDYPGSVINFADLPDLSNFNIKGAYILVQPWFDHPPLLPLIVGGWVKLFGYNFPSHVPSLIYRLPMLLFSTATLYLVFLITKKLFGYFSALFSLILIGFTPSIVIIQRMVVGENLYIPFILLSIYLVLTQNKIIKPIFFSILSGLSKITGLLVIPLITYYLLLKKEYKKAIVYFILSLGLFALIYSIYGYLLSWPQFIKMLDVQSYRPIGWLNPAFIFSNPGFHNKVILDAGYYLILFLGLTALFIPSSNKTHHSFVRFLIFAPFLLIWASSPETANLGWYKIPFFTLLTISAGKIIKKNINYPLLILVAMTVLNNCGLVRDALHPYVKPIYVRLVLLFVFGFLFIFTLFPKPKINLKKTILTILLVGYILSSFYAIDHYYETICQHKICPLPILTFKQVVNSALN